MLGWFARQIVISRDGKNGDFREDLFYRLNVVSVELPPLRERGDDIHFVADFLEQFSEEMV